MEQKSVHEVNISELAQDVERAFYSLTQEDAEIREVIAVFPEVIDRERGEDLVSVLLYEFVKVMKAEYVPDFKLIENGEDYSRQEGVFTVSCSFPIDKDEFVKLVCREFAWFLVSLIVAAA